MHFLDCPLYPVCSFLASSYCKTALSKSFGPRTTDSQRKGKLRVVQSVSW